MFIAITTEVGQTWPERGGVVVGIVLVIIPERIDDVADLADQVDLTL
jgi:hypothetical protein